jgi:hypothetical protein
MTAPAYQLAWYRVYSFAAGVLVLVEDEPMPLGAFMAAERGGMVLVWHGHSSSAESAIRAAL